MGCDWSLLAGQVRAPIAGPLTPSQLLGKSGTENRRKAEKSGDRENRGQERVKKLVWADGTLYRRPRFTRQAGTNGRFLRLPPATILSNEVQRNLT